MSHVCQDGLPLQPSAGYPCEYCGAPDPRSPFDPTPPKLCPDPQLGTRDGWTWCADCCGIQSPGHVHGDPIEQMDAEELRRLVRVMRLAER